MKKICVVMTICYVRPFSLLQVILSRKNQENSFRVHYRIGTIQLLDK